VVPIDEIRQQALRLAVTDRADLARALLDSLDDLTEAEIEQLWIEEAVRRKAQLKAGTAKSIPADEVIARLRARLSD
jgi:putative addiction module component (TIGR02574 family)